MAVVLITDSTLMPDIRVSLVKKDEEENDNETVSKILGDLKEDIKGGTEADGERKTFVNSIITKINVENPPENFKLNLYSKPIIDIVSHGKLN
jgi:hypothetical protein